VSWYVDEVATEFFKGKDNFWDDAQALLKEMWVKTTDLFDVLKKAEGGWAKWFFKVVWMGAKDKLGVEDINMAAEMKKVLGNDEAYNKFVAVKKEREWKNPGKDFFTEMMAWLKIKWYDIEGFMETETTKLLVATDTKHVGVKQALLWQLNWIMDDETIKNIDSIIRIDDPDMVKILNGMLKPWSSIAGTPLPEFMGHPAIMANMMTICMGPVMIKNWWAIAMNNPKLQGYIATKLLGNDKALTDIATTIHWVLKWANLSLPSGESLPDISELTKTIWIT